MYFLNFLDRNAMVNGKLNSLSQDLNLKGTQYNTCISILFVGYDHRDGPVHDTSTDPTNLDTFLAKYLPTCSSIESGLPGLWLGS